MKEQVSGADLREAAAAVGAKRDAGNWWTWIVIALSVVISYIPSFFIPINRDSGLFGYSGWRILHGALPYKDFWDNKLPGVYYINALAIKLFGMSQAGLVVFQMIYITLTAWAFYAVARRLCSIKAALIGTILFVFYHGSYGLAEDGNYTETYIALPCLLAVLLILNWSRDRKGYALPAFAGALVALAAIIKQPAAALLAGLVLFVVFSEQRRSGIAAARTVILGAAVPAVLLVLWMLHEKILSQAIGANLIFNKLYVTEAYTNGLAAAMWGLKRSMSMCALPLVGAIAGAVSLRFRRPSSPAIGWLLIPWFICDIAGVTMGGRFNNHYFVALLASALLLTTLFIDLALQHRRIAIAAGVAGILLFFGPTWNIESPQYKGIPITSIAEREYHVLDWIINKRLARGDMLPYEQAAAWVREHTNENDLIYVWGWDTRIAFLARRAFPTRYLHTHPLGATGFNREARIRELARDLKRGRPVYVIDASPLMPTTAPPLAKVPTPPSWSPFFRLDGYEPVQDVVARYYKPVANINGYVIWELRPDVK